MAPSIDLCSSSEVKSYLGLTGSTHDDVIAALITPASEAIENFCRREFDETSHTEYFDGLDKDRIVLSHRPVTAVSGLWDDPSRDFDDASLVDTDEYVIDEERGIIRLLAGAFSDGVRNVKVTYTGGYATIPKDVAQACVMLVAAWLHRGREGADGLTARNAGGTAQQFESQSLPAAVRQVLLPYREPVA